LLAFSLIFFAVTLYFSLRPGRILDWVGKYLTPIFVILLSIILIATYASPMGQVSQYAPQGNYIDKPLFTGILDGYNTMDALASLAFAIIIISTTEKLGAKKQKRKVIETCKSASVCLVGMSTIYASLAYMGATSLGSVSSADNGGTIMSMVSEHYFGLIGQVLLAAIVIVACLKTAIGLITACAQMFSEMFPKSGTYRKYAMIFTGVSFILANFGLTKIIQLSLPVLMLSYPLAITLIILSLLAPFIHKQRDIYRWTTLLTLVAAFFDFCNALPKGIKETIFIKHIIDFAYRYLPGFDYGFGWVIPALGGMIIGTILWRVRAKS
jgi:LIVCS family branched-chain amino acid:cation transporter